MTEEGFQGEAMAADFDPGELSAEHRRELLQVARRAIAGYLETGAIPPQEATDPLFNHRAGVFVTLRKIPRRPGGRWKFFEPAPEETLRGCVGRMQADLPLYQVVPEMAIRAAVNDPRFLPMSRPELDQCRIEISILSPLREVQHLAEIEIGKHGLLIDGQGMRGVLLPKVASSRGWSREEFLDNTCRKAGLPVRSWPGMATLYSFTALDFEEADEPE